jgi:hypothetical protein
MFQRQSFWSKDVNVHTNNNNNNNNLIHFFNSVQLFIYVLIEHL